MLTGAGDLTSVSVIVSTARIVVTTWKRDVEEDNVIGVGEGDAGRTAAGIVVGVYLYVEVESDKVAIQNKAARLTKNPCIPKHNTHGKASAVNGELSRSARSTYHTTAEYPAPEIFVNVTVCLALDKPDLDQTTTVSPATERSGHEQSTGYLTPSRSISSML